MLPEEAYFSVQETLTSPNLKKLFRLSFGEQLIMRQAPFARASKYMQDTDIIIQYVAYLILYNTYMLLIVTMLI